MLTKKNLQNNPYAQTNHLFNNCAEPVETMLPDLPLGSSGAGWNVHVIFTACAPVPIVMSKSCFELIGLSNDNSSQLVEWECLLWLGSSIDSFLLLLKKKPPSTLLLSPCTPPPQPHHLCKHSQQPLPPVTSWNGRSVWGKWQEKGHITLSYWLCTVVWKVYQIVQGSGIELFGRGREVCFSWPCNYEQD